MGWLSFGILAAFVPFWPDGANAPRWALLSVVVPFWLWRIRPIEWSSGLCILSWFCIWAVFTLLWCPVLWDGLEIVWHILLFFGVAVIVQHTRFNPAHAYIGAGLALLINTVVVGFQLEDVYVFPQANGPGGLFFNRNLWAEPAALVAVGLVTGGWTYERAVLAIGAALPLLGSYSIRGASLGLLTGLTAAVWQRNRFAATVALILGAGVVTRLVSIPERLNAAWERVALWQEIWKDSTFWGHGPGAVRFMSPYYEYAHNDALQILYEFGVPGLFLLGAFFAYCLWHGHAREKCVLLAFLAEGCFGFPFFVPATCFLAAVAAGCVLRSRPVIRTVDDGREHPHLDWQTRYQRGDVGTRCW